MAKRDEITKFCNEHLAIDKFADMCPNGMQFVGKEEVQKIVTGVSMSRDLCAAAVEQGADLILVHHGEFWEGSSQRVDKVRKGRLKVLFEHDISLLAYHLPLDAHREVGNNAMLCQKMGFELLAEDFGEYKGMIIGTVGKHTGLPREEFVEKLDEMLGTRSLVLGFGPDTLKKVGFVSGGGASELSEAIVKDLDTFVTGESKESTYHRAKEAEINLIYAHHYNSEKLGVQALGALLADKFKIEVEFIDVPCPL